MTPPFDIEQGHRWFAVEYNNGTWDLLEKADRTDEETERMINNAHASVAHWNEVGKEINALRGYCLLTNVYAAAGDGAGALRYGERLLALTDRKPEGMQQWDIAFSYDALARANAAAGQEESAANYKEMSRSAGEAIPEEGERKMFDAWNASIQN